MADAALQGGARAQRRFAVLTAYSSDYQVGELAARVNAAYAARHSYQFAAAVFERTSAALEGRAPPWVKVRLLNNVLVSLLSRKVSSPSGSDRSSGHTSLDDSHDCNACDHYMGSTARHSSPAGDESRDAMQNERSYRMAASGDPFEPRIRADTTHLIWIDADAVILNHARSAESILGKSHPVPFPPMCHTPLFPCTNAMISLDLRCSRRAHRASASELFRDAQLF